MIEIETCAENSSHDLVGSDPSIIFVTVLSMMLTQRSAPTKT